MSMACPHCSAINPSPGAFCTSCGKALPTSGAAPRVLAEGELASSASAQRVQAEELLKKCKQASGALFAVAVVVLLGVALIFGMTGGRLSNLGVTIVVANVIVAALFIGLGFWARKAPLPAAIVGLVIIGTLWIVDMILDPSAIGRGIVVKAVILVVLVGAIKAGVAYRQLKRTIDA